MDAIIYLRQEHNKFRKALVTISKTKTERLKLSKFNRFCTDLVRHETMEQKKWYPTLRKNMELRKIIKHLLAEEKSAAKAIKSFKKMEFGTLWKLKFLKFKRDVDHHARQEEKKLFPKVRELLTKIQLNALGTKMRKFKSKLRKK